MSVSAYLKAPVPRWVALVALSAASAGSVLVTYKSLRRKLEAEYDLRLAKEVRATQNYYRSIHTKDYESPEDAVAALVVVEERVEAIIVEESYDAEDSEIQLTEVSTNIFTDASPSVWDPDAEEAARDPSKPYIIEHDEYYESNWQSATLTYFTEDGVLADEKDEFIPDVDDVVGEENLTKFGHGSRDPNILYVKNERLDLIFEIVKAEGKYTEQIMGFVQHDEGRRLHKFHLDED